MSLSFWDIARYWSKIADLNLPYLYLAPRWGWSRWNFADVFVIEKLEFFGLSYGVVYVILGFAIL